MRKKLETVKSTGKITTHQQQVLEQVRNNLPLHPASALAVMPLLQVGVIALASFSKEKWITVFKKMLPAEGQATKEQVKLCLEGKPDPKLEVLDGLRYLVETVDQDALGLAAFRLINSVAEGCPDEDLVFAPDPVLSAVHRLIRDYIKKLV